MSVLPADLEGGAVGDTKVMWAAKVKGWEKGRKAV
jgi:hypothetical protein